MSPELVIALVIFATGFGAGYLVRHQVSARRRREAERRHGLV
ncbi:MAG TPA: hypothetical protein VHL98_05490 [Microvirga sp.]|jgi:hypothetical protein|nr:hypothetical protein [Microvirga sp.]